MHEIRSRATSVVPVAEKNEIAFLLAEKNESVISDRIVSSLFIISLLLASFLLFRNAGNTKSGNLVTVAPPANTTRQTTWTKCARGSHGSHGRHGDRATAK